MTINPSEHTEAVQRHEAAEAYSSRWRNTRGLMERLAMETHFKAGWMAAETAIREQIVGDILALTEALGSGEDYGARAYNAGLDDAARIARGES